MAKQKSNTDTKRTLTKMDIDALKEVFLTKDDAKNFATKDDLKNLVTRDDAKKFATHEDIANVLLGDNLRTLKDLFREVVREEELVTKSDISHLPTKEEYFSREDEQAGELNTIRQEQIVLSHQVSRISDRVDRLEKN